MLIATAIVSGLTMFFLLQSALLKFRDDPRVMEQIVGAAGVPESWLPWLGATEIAGGVGLLVGLGLGPIGVAAGIGLVVYFVCAVGAHVRRGDRHIGPAVFLLLMSGLALGLQIANL